jgi:hypothetical protein
VNPAEAVALVWLMADRYREQLLRRAEHERDRPEVQGHREHWTDHATIDTEALGQWRADWALAVGPS